MTITDTRVSLIGEGAQDGLAAYCAVTFDHVFVVRDVRVVKIDGRTYVSMPERKIQSACPHCRERNALRARFCGECGGRLPDPPAHDAHGRPTRFLVDVVHPIRREFRAELERTVIDAYQAERSRNHSAV